MCGIAGFWDKRVRVDTTMGYSCLQIMSGAIAHRGPDDEGVWFDRDAGLGLAHRRLSIIDPSPGGRQPMRSASGRWIIVYNGEIYNSEQLRSDLVAGGCAIAWRGHSDTEVLLEAIEAWGVERAVKATTGMFAFAAWDQVARALYLVRDRAGEKPLYFGHGRDGVLLFGSELKALRAHPSFDGSIDREAVAAYLRFGYVPGPLSIYSGIEKLPPASIVRFDAANGDASMSCYWNAPVFGERGPAQSRDESLRTLDALVSDAVGLQMRSDVPMGAFLSGGVDSSLIVALMQKQSIRPVKTFSIGFEEGSYNEAKHASEVAKFLGTDHRELYVTADDALKVIPELPAIYDEPFSDSSQIPTYLLSRLTREHVTVALSGDAGDELFGGYARYFQSSQFGRILGLTPPWMRAALGKTIRSTPSIVWDTAARISPARFASLFTSGRTAKIAAALEAQDIYAIYQRLVSQWQDPLAVTYKTPRAGWIDDDGLRQRAPSPTAWMMTVDFRTYLTDDILVKVDRASMAASLETRVPMLDHRLIDFAATLPLSWNIFGGTGKRMLRDLLDQYVPRSIIDRPKQGFGVPIDQWLRGPLRDWAEDLLDPNTLEQNGLLDPIPIREAWDRHLSGVENLHHPLWTILMLQSWRRANDNVLSTAA